MAGKILFILPVYNEQDCVGKNSLLLCDFLEEKIQGDWTIRIVDNASTDNTLKMAQDASRECKKITVLHLDEKGKGRAIKNAMKDLSYDVYAFLDIDMSTDMNHIPELLRWIDEGYDVVIGSRLLPGSNTKRSFRREILSRGYNILTRLLLGLPVRDTHCGFKALTRSVVEDVVPKVEDNEFFFDTELLARANKTGYKIKEMPVSWIEDADSKVNVKRTVINYLKNLVKLRRSM